MQIIKNALIVVVLAAAAYGVYMAVTVEPAAPPPPGAEEIADGGLQIELPESTPGSDAVSADTAERADDLSPPPRYIPGARNAPDAEAPRFDSDRSTDDGSRRQGDSDSSAPRFAPEGGAPRFEPGSDDRGVAPPSVPPDLSHPSAQGDPTGYPTTPDDASPLDTAPDEGFNPESGLSESAEVPAGYSSPREGGDFAGDMRLVQQLLDQDKLARAHEELSQWYNDPDLSSAERAHLVKLLDDVAGTVVYSRQHLLEPPYEVQPGDSLDRIATAYQVPWELLAKINGITDPSRLRPGDRIKVMRGPFHAVVDLAQFELSLWLEGRYAGRFPIGIGQDASTPEGEFTVRNKVTNPTYYGPDEVIDKDDPENPLGERALDLGNHLWIHGTHDEATIGDARSRGCIRLSARDVADVFDILSVGSNVVIRR